jgi:hypothetical protein
MRSGWAPEPSCGRGTLEIVWTCLVTIFACTYTVLHPSFAVDGGPLSPGIPTILTALIAPEFVSGIAYSEYCYAREFRRVIKQNHGISMTMEQTFFIQSGGVDIKFKDMTCRLGQIFGFGFDNQIALAECAECLKAGIGIINQLSKDDIKERRKSDRLVKMVVCIQASWVVVQVIGRGIQGLHTTTLEITTVAYVACALMTYLLWWNKPQRASVVIEVSCTDMSIEEFRTKP